jgi:hypothetical protein
VGTRGPSRGVSGARRGLRHEGAVQGRWERGREQNERERVVGKAAGDECVFIPGEGPSWQIKSSDTIPEAAGGEGDHGAARPDGVIHRYRIYPHKFHISFCGQSPQPL